MAEVSASRERSLHELVQAIQLAHRKDIYDFSGGHLNETNLPKPPAESHHKSWDSARKAPIKMVPKSELPKPKMSKRPDDRMKNTLLNFSIGTQATIPTTQKSRKLQPVPSVQKSRRESYVSDSIHVEEVQFPDLMLPSPRYDKNLGIPQEEYDSVVEPLPQSLIKERNLARIKHQFVPSYLSGITKKDQYRKFLDFESTILRKQDTTEQNILSGIGAVEHLEMLLKEELERLEHPGHGPSFHRLQVYSYVFDALIAESPSLGFMLRKVKREYDGYVSFLLDSNPPQHRVLHDQVEQLSAKGTSKPGFVTKEREKLMKMEKEAEQLLSLNSRLRKEIEEEKLLACVPEEILQPAEVHTPAREEHPVVTADKIEETRANILAKLDEINMIRANLRSHYVPAKVCVQLEQCIKETEIENQKHLKKVELHEAIAKELEKELEEALEAVDASDTDKQRVWKRLAARSSDSANSDNSNSLKSGSDTSVSNISNIDKDRYEDLEDVDDENDEEDSDSTKWNWYIS